MCGIAGAVSFNGRTEEIELYEMIASLSHRGPDKQEVKTFNSGYANVGLAHARLSIIDLTDAASQPMSYDGFTIVFNGEIYNYQEIREELIKKGHRFTTSSDTEVILHAFEEWKERAVHKFIGMFAFVLLDEREQKIYCYRDRAGVKPFHYYWDESNFIFGSELKAILKHSQFKKEINEEAAAYYFKMGYVASPLTIYKNTYKLDPGHFAILDLVTKKLEVKQYWNSIDYFQKPKLSLSYQDAKDQLKELLISAFDYRMVADVPVGVFLSGGYDSTAVAAFLQKDRTEKLKTFTIGFTEGNNEAPYARQTAEFLGTDHTDYICTTKEAQEIIPKLPYFYDEPFADSSAIPTLLVSQLAKSRVKVALSADAGDELFAGYNSYRSLDKNVQLLGKIGFIDYKVIGQLLQMGSHLLKRESFLAQKVQYTGKLLQSNKNERYSLIHEGAQSLPVRLYEKLVSGLKYPADKFPLDERKFDDAISIAQAIDYNLYLPNDILTKVDRATMAVSLEGREPLVDHRIWEFAAQLPLAYKFDATTGKKILKEIVHDIVPKKMMNRPKTGFSLPVNSWLKGDLSFLLDEFLTTKAVNETGLLNSSYVKMLVRSFKANKLHHESIIWRILQFQMWYKQWI